MVLCDQTVYTLRRVYTCCDSNNERYACFDNLMILLVNT